MGCWDPRFLLSNSSFHLYLCIYFPSFLLFSSPLLSLLSLFCILFLKPVTWCGRSFCPTLKIKIIITIINSKTLGLLVSQHLARNLCGFKLIEMVDKQNQNLGHVIEQIKTPPSRDFHSSRIISVLCLAFCSIDHFVFIRNPRLELQNGDGKSGCYLVLGST
jgi:hypothetical protein